MELRRIKASDMGAVCKIIKGIGIKEFKESLNIDDLNGNVEKIGVEVVFGIATTIVENMPKAQRDIDLFLASLTGQEIQEIQEMNFDEYGELIIQVVTKKEFQDFFKRVMKLFNR